MSFLALLLLHPCALLAPAQGDGRPSLEVQCDADSIRESGLVASGVTDEDAWRALQLFAEWRLAVRGLEVEVEPDPGASVLKLEGQDDAQLQAARGVVARGLSPCHFFLAAEDEDVGGELDDERMRFEVWLAQNPGRSWLDYNSDPGRVQRQIAWFPTRFAETVGPPFPVCIPREAEREFSGSDFARVYPAQDGMGFPAVGFELVDERIDDFAAFTEAGVNRRLAIVLRGEVRSAPTLNTRLVGGGIIEGRFKEEEVRDLIAVLREGGAFVERPSPFTPSLVVRLFLTVGVLIVIGAVLWRVMRKRAPPENPDAEWYGPLSG